MSYKEEMIIYNSIIERLDQGGEASGQICAFINSLNFPGLVRYFGLACASVVLAATESGFGSSNANVVLRDALEKKLLEIEPFIRVEVMRLVHQSEGC